MTIREELEQREHMMLSPWAARADGTRGRLRPEEENEVRTCYQRDVDRIVYCKSFRRLKHKTQVFLQPEGDHYRTRLTHTLEVMRISRTIARALQLNEDLTEAIAFGHDLGHTPFGHAGEKALSDITGKAFRHNEQSLRVVDILEKDGEGLNLTYETRMGIVGHTGDFIPETLEGQIIRLADRIAYINHDIDDARRAGILREQRYPKGHYRRAGPDPFPADQHSGDGHHPSLPGTGSSGARSGSGGRHGAAAGLYVRAGVPESRGKGRGIQGQRHHRHAL